MPSPGAAKKKILLVDDERVFLQVTQLRLESEGYEVATALNGKEGMAKALQIRPDLILLDLNMPEKGGYTTLRSLKENKQTGRIPVIILTAKDGAISRAAAEDLGAADFMAKPCPPEELLSFIRRCL